LLPVLIVQGGRCCGAGAGRNDPLRLGRALACTDRKGGILQAAVVAGVSRGTLRRGKPIGPAVAI